MYQGGVPPWDIGRPQGAFVRLEEAGQIRDPVLDVGCGTGENAIYLASRGHDVWGIDGSPTAILKAGEKAARRGSSAHFVHGSALDLGALEGTYNTVIDSGFFHTLTDTHRTAFDESLKEVLPEGGGYFMMCFSEHEPSDGGPRRLTQSEIRLAFSKGWRVASIEASRFEDTFHRGGAQAWLAHIVRVLEG